MNQQMTVPLGRVAVAGPLVNEAVVTNKLAKIYTRGSLAPTPWLRPFPAPARAEEQMSGLKPQNFSWAANFALFDVSPEAYLIFKPLYQILCIPLFTSWRLSLREMKSVRYGGSY